MKQQFLLCVTHSYYAWLFSSLILIPILFFLGLVIVFGKTCIAAWEGFSEAAMDLIDDFLRVSFSYQNFKKIQERYRTKKQVWIPHNRKADRENNRSY